MKPASSFTRLCSFRFGPKLIPRMSSNGKQSFKRRTLPKADRTPRKDEKRKHTFSSDREDAHKDFFFEKRIDLVTLN